MCAIGSGDGFLVPPSQLHIAGYASYEQGRYLEPDGLPLTMNFRRTFFLLCPDLQAMPCMSRAGT